MFDTRESTVTEIQTTRDRIATLEEHYRTAPTSGQSRLIANALQDKREHLKKCEAALKEWDRPRSTPAYLQRFLDSAHHDDREDFRADYGRAPLELD